MNVYMYVRCMSFLSYTYSSTFVHSQLGSILVATWKLYHSPSRSMPRMRKRRQISAAQHRNSNHKYRHSYVTRGYQETSGCQCVQQFHNNKDGKHTIISYLHAIIFITSKLHLLLLFRSCSPQTTLGTPFVQLERVKRKGELNRKWLPLFILPFLVLCQIFRIWLHSRWSRRACGSRVAQAATARSRSSWTAEATPVVRGDRPPPYLPCWTPLHCEVPSSCSFSSAWSLKWMNKS